MLKMGHPRKLNDFDSRLPGVGFNNALLSGAPGPPPLSSILPLITGSEFRIQQKGCRRLCKADVARPITLLILQIMNS